MYVWHKLTSIPGPHSLFPSRVGCGGVAGRGAPCRVMPPCGCAPCGRPCSSHRDASKGDSPASGRDLVRGHLAATLSQCWRPPSTCTCLMLDNQWIIDEPDMMQNLSTHNKLMPCLGPLKPSKIWSESAWRITITTKISVGLPVYKYIWCDMGWLQTILISQKKPNNSKPKLPPKSFLLVIH